MSGKRRSDRAPLSRLLELKYPESEPKELFAAVLCGEISVNGEKLRDPKALVPKTSDISWTTGKYVGRGGFKLEGALDDLGLSPEGLVCLDAGSSTGGFTDCLLSRGAILVHSVDVGYNQLAWKLRSDSRVAVYERTNLMDLSTDNLYPRPVFAVADLSFRSLRGAASKLLELTSGAPVLALVKPQFEQPEEENFDGVVRTREARAAVIHSLRSDLPSEGVHVLDTVASRVTGRKGNAEIFLLLSSKPAPDPPYVDRRIENALDEAERRQRQD
jgi:23S rRNA (cytidine1920-2'-O)/16S rRNA (cytidine1409-2'-O)-methyltransferase